nr:hypothetical protein [Tanacetum cinerariifolium]
MLHSKELASSKQTALSKDISNPFMAGSLPTKCLVPAKSNSYYQAFNVKSQFREIDRPEKYQVELEGQIKMIHTNIADLSKHNTRYISPALTQKVFANMRRVGKGFSGVETPLFKSMLVVRDVAEEAKASVTAQGDDVQEPTAEEVVTKVVPPTPTPPSPPSPVLDTCSALAHRVEVLENDKSAQQLEIVKLKARVKKLEKINMVKSSKLRRLKKVGTSQRVESSDDVENVFNQGRIIVDMDQDEGIELVADQEKDAEVEGRHADKQEEIYNIDLDHSSKVLSMQEDYTEVVAASTPIPAAKSKILNIDAAPTVSTRMRKGVVIRDPKEGLPSDIPAETPKVKVKGKGILIEAPKPLKKKDQIEMDAEYAKKLHEEINKEHEEAYKNIDWKAALDHNTEGYKMDFLKGKKYDEILPIFQAKFDANMRFLFKSREEMEKEDEEIIKSINETPAQKAAKRRKLSEEAQEAKNLRNILEILFLLVERRYPLSRFTLKQLVNVERLQVEKESEMSLELLRSKKNTKCVSAANEELTA